MDHDAAHKAWIGWLDKVPEKKRDELAGLISEADLSTYAGIAQLQIKLQVALVRGLLSPTMLEAFRSLTKDAMAALYLDNERNREPAIANVVTRQMNVEILRAIEERPLQPVYRRSIGDEIAKEHASNIIDADEEDED